MDLNNVAAVLRSRRGMQSVDLGILLGRRFWGPILRAWLVLAVPVLVISQTVTYFVTGWWWAMVLVGWWLKPLFDRITLYIISRGFFGRVPSTKETVKAVLKQWRSGQALADLTWRRFSPLRTVVMPIRVLEGLRGKAARDRIGSFLDSSAQTHGFGLLIGAVGFKWVLYASVVVLAVMVTPVDMGADIYSVFQYLDEGATDWEVAVLVMAVTTLVTLLVEPFFGAGGFGIYIQRRIEREGWDLELRFRRLAMRIKESFERGVLLFIVGLLGLMSGVGAPASVYGQEMVGAQELVWTEEGEPEIEAVEGAVSGPVDRGLIPRENPTLTLKQILQSSPFEEGVKTEMQWVPKNRDEGNWELAPTWKVVAAVVANLARAGLWIVAFLALCLFGLRFYQYLAGRSGGGGEKRERTRWEEEILAKGGEVGVLPDDVGRAARESWQEGDRRRALAILLLSSLLRFEERYRYQFAPGWTTARCAREVRARSPEGPVIVAIARAFDELAWAGRSVSGERFEALVTSWEETFGAANVGGVHHG